MKRRLIPLLMAALLCFCFAAAAEGDTLAFDTGVTRVNEGETLQTVLTREGDAAGGELTYTSQDERVATVDENGLVTAVKKGNVTITATVKTEKKTYRAQLKLTVVRPVASLTVATDKLPLYEAADGKVAVYLTPREDAEENGLPVLLLPVQKKQALTVTAEPKDASNRNIVLTGSDSAVFTTAKNAVTGVAPGEGILTIASESNPDVSVRYRVLVVQPVKKLTVASSAPSVAVGGQVAVTAAASPENATMQGVAWSSGSENIATVDADGIVTGLKRGNGRIIATALDGSNVRANFTLKVVQNPESIELASGEVTIDVGRNASVKATVLPKDTDDKKVTWTSSDESIATVGKDGRIQAVSRGDCTVTCTSQALDSVSAVLAVHVQQPVKKLTFNEKTALVYVGETTQLAWTVEPEDATNQTLTFKSAKESIATVDEQGAVTGVSSGKVNITAMTTDGSKRKAQITVHTGKHVTGVHMVRKHAYIDKGESARAGANIEPKDALDKRMSWSSSDEGVVTTSLDKNGNMYLKGVSHGTATVTGVTEDGGFETSLPVTVGNFDKGLSFRDFDVVDNETFWLTIRNDTDMTITRITAEIEMFNYLDNIGADLPINSKDGSNKVEVVWTGKLRPGEKTGKKNWKMVDYRLPPGFAVDDTHGTITLVSYQIENDWIKTIQKKNRPTKKY